MNNKLQILLLALIIIMPFWLHAQSDKSFVRKGNQEFKNGNFNEAEINYRKALDQNPEKHSAQFNLGDALFEQENYEKAAEVFNATNKESLPTKHLSNNFYNLGNSLLKAGKLQESIDAYKKALKANPKNEEARYNLEYARQKLQQQQQQQENQDQQKDQNKDQKQDQDKKDQNQDKNQDKKDQEQQKQEQQQQDQQQNQSDQKEQQGQQNEQQAQKISKKDAERMLDALKNNEKKTLEKLKKEQKKNAKVIKSEKDW